MQRILGLAPAYAPSQQLPPLPVLGRPRRGNRPVRGGKANRSVGTMLLSRCGIDLAPYLTDAAFRGLLDFSTPSPLNILSSAVVETAAMCLIAKAARRAQAAPAAHLKPVLLQSFRKSATRCKAGGSLPLWAETILYRFLDLPKQEPVSVSHKDFEQWLAPGFVRPVPAAAPA